MDGKVITTRHNVNKNFYGEDLEPLAILSGAVDPPPAAAPLYDALRRCSYYVEQSLPSDSRGRERPTYLQRPPAVVEEELIFPTPPRLRNPNFVPPSAQATKPSPLTMDSDISIYSIDSLPVVPISSSSSSSTEAASLQEVILSPQQLQPLTQPQPMVTAQTQPQFKSTGVSSPPFVRQPNPYPEATPNRSLQSEQTQRLQQRSLPPTTEEWPF